MLDYASQPSNLTALILGSAAIGALVSSVITIIGQSLDRSAKKKELLFSKAIELSHAYVALLTEMAKSGKAVMIRPMLVYTRRNHRELKLLYENGKLSPRLEEKFKSDIYGPGSDSEEGE